MAGLFLSLIGLLGWARLVDAVGEGSYGLRKNSSTGAFGRPNDDRRLPPLVLRLVASAEAEPIEALSLTRAGARDVAPVALSLPL